MKLLPIIFTFILGFSACIKPAESPTEPTRASEISASYGSHERQKMDIYLVANRNEQTPLVVLIHGGAWEAGDKNDMRLFADSLRAKGINAVSINYRYGNTAGVNYQQMMDDVESALKKLVEKAGEWKIRKNKYLLCGASAGGHMALLFAHRYNTLSLVSATISLAGPTNLADDEFVNYAFLIGLLPQLENLVGANWNFGTNKTPFMAASPYHGPVNIPTQLFYGDADLVVPVAQGRMFNTLLGSKSFIKEYTEFKGAGHDLGLGGAANRDSLTKAISRWAYLYGQ